MPIGASQLLSHDVADKFNGVAYRPHLSLSLNGKAIWDATKENYSDFENASQVFEVKNKLKEMQQGNLDIT